MTLTAPRQKERSFNILELCCFPKGCRIDPETRPYLATVLVPQLEEAGMQTVEWTKGALMLEEPFLSKVKAVVCRGCCHIECVHNPKAWMSGGLLAFVSLLHTSYQDRASKNAELEKILVSRERAEEWAKKGINLALVWISSSRTRVNVAINASKGDKTVQISILFSEARRTFRVYGSKEEDLPLPDSIEEVISKIDSVMAGL